MLHSTKLKLVFWGCLVIGTALCIGGAWVAPLLVPGGILLAAAFGMFQSAYSAPQQEDEDHFVNVNNMVSHPPEVNASPVLIEQNIGLFFVYPNGRRSPLELEYPDRPHAPTPSRLTLT